MRICKGMFAGIAAMAVPALCSAVVVTMTGDDGRGSSSINSAGGWDSASAPSAGNDYYTAGHLLRTPNSTAAVTFAGDSLTVEGSGDYTTANNNAFMFKNTGVLTVNNLIVNGGEFRHGMGLTETGTLAGNLTVGSLGMITHVQGPTVVNANLLGSGTITLLENGDYDGRLLLTFAGANNTFNGDIVMGAASDAYKSRLQFAENSAMNFLIGAAGVNNSISGIGSLYMDGIMVLDLASASTSIGDQWTLLDTGREIYGTTFSVDGFSDMGDGTWYLDNGGAEYEFSESTGTLTVIPEPATIGLLGMSGLGLFFARRRSRR